MNDENFGLLILQCLKLVYYLISMCIRGNDESVRNFTSNVIKTLAQEGEDVNVIIIVNVNNRDFSPSILLNKHYNGIDMDGVTMRI